MNSKFPEYENLNLSLIANEIQEWWEQKGVFEKSVSEREGRPSFIFYEGPPSANGMPGIHHVMSRTIKDLFCRYKTLKGFQVKRKAGWDTHGLPVELAVEKELGITKEDIGKTISIEDYNKECRKAVMKYKSVWDNLTTKMGYWVDLNNPYITYENSYIESVWHLLKKLYDKKLLYKGYTIQPYSPAAGTGLSSHELNLPGCYKMVKDNTAVAMFKVKENEKSKDLFSKLDIRKENVKVKNFYFLAWTTTPWTLSSNSALAIGKNINYAFVATINKFTKEVCVVVIAENLFSRYFQNITPPIKDISEKQLEELNSEFGEDNIGLLNEFLEIGYFDWKGKNDFGLKIRTVPGSMLEGLSYEQLLPYAQPLDGEEPFKVILGDFVSTEDGTGIVHIAPTFGADDMRVAKQNGISGILVKDENGDLSPLVDKRGRFVKEMQDDAWGFAGELVKEEYLSPEEKEREFLKQKKNLEAQGKIKDLKEYLSVDKRITLKLQEEGKLFKKEIYEHNYPHCWRTDKPVLYYPLDSWFIKTTAAKDRMIELNKTINWKPEHTGSGRFGEWLNNLQDWNLSRSRYWGIPLPVWRTEDGKEEIIIGSLEQLSAEVEKALAAGLMKENLCAKKDFELHRPFVDEIVLISPSRKPMKRELDLIDVWFDSGAMPYAQYHYMGKQNTLPFGEGRGGASFPADYIAEGVDQTRGWFYTLHAIATMCFDSVAYKNVISNGLVLDKNGQKMSKRLGNVVNPFDTIDRFGPDATRWYLITNSQPWDNLKFDLEGITEVQKKFFRALHNTYAFFALYANIDEYRPAGNEIPVGNRPEMDRWIISELNHLVKTVESCFENYEPTAAGRHIEKFVVDKLSNWYVRLNRRRFWKGEKGDDKTAAYQTLFHCLETVAKLASPIAPFYSEKLFRDLNFSRDGEKTVSVHLSDFPAYDDSLINIGLQEKMEIAQSLSSMVLGLRKKEKIRVRQPLQKILVPGLNPAFVEKLEAVRDLILSEVNVKQLEIISVNTPVLEKKIKPNFKILGPKYGKRMKDIAAATEKFSQDDLAAFESAGNYCMEIAGEKIDLQISDFEILSQSRGLGEGWVVASEGRLTAALDISISDQLKEEGIAREIVNKIQNIRKDKGLEVTDKISLKIQSNKFIDIAINNNLNYICSETLASSLSLVDKISPENASPLEVEEGLETLIQINRCEL